MDSGTRMYRSYFPLPYGTQIDAKYAVLYPVFRKLMYPGDVFKVHADLLIRYQPMVAPPMNNAKATVRFAFVPLRNLLEENTELIVTGSNDGHLSEETLPIMDSCFKYLKLVDSDSQAYKVNYKHSLLDYLYNIPKSNTDLSSDLRSKLDAAESSPAAYFAKAYYRFWWDYYRDENLYTTYTDFETFWEAQRQVLHLADESLMFVNLKKDYFTKSLPWQLKAVAAPRIQVIGEGTVSGSGVTFNFGNSTGSEGKYYNKLAVTHTDGSQMGGVLNNQTYHSGSNYGPFELAKASSVSSANAQNDEFARKMENALSNNTLNGTVADLSWVGISGADIRDVLAQTRVYERLARCGSRYTEYLRANFGIAPADDTLQRAQYLGGFKTQIVTTEVVQTAGAGDNPVGTLRGHGITHGTSTIKPFMAKEIGVMIGVLDIMPEVQYAQGVDRELCARKRFDFLNPSFQHLSEQQVRKGEIYFDTDVDATDGHLINDDTWGFMPYAEELRRGWKHVAGDMRDSLAFWNQSLIFGSRPSLNQAFLAGTSHLGNFNRPFAVSGSEAYPMVVDFGGVIEAYRPLVKDGTPGLADHN